MRTVDAKNDEVASFLYEFFAAQHHRANLFLSKASTLFLRDMKWIEDTAAALKEHGTLSAEKDV